MSWWRKLLSGEEKNTPSNNASVPNPDTIQSTESLIESPDTLDWQFIKEDELKPFDEISNVQITKSIKKNTNHTKLAVYQSGRYESFRRNIL